MALKEGETIEESSGDLFFTSTAKEFRTDLLLSRNITSRTFSFYYPRTRPQKSKERFAVVSSTNANWSDWADLSPDEYEASKADLVESTIEALDKYLPGIRDKIDRADMPALARDLPGMLHADCADVVAQADALIVTHANDLYRQAVRDAGPKPVVDLVRISADLSHHQNCNGIGW